MKSEVAMTALHWAHKREEENYILCPHAKRANMRRVADWTVDCGIRHACSLLTVRSRFLNAHSQRNPLWHQKNVIQITRFTLTGLFTGFTFFSARFPRSRCFAPESPLIRRGLSCISASLLVCSPPEPSSIPLPGAVFGSKWPKIAPFWPQNRGFLRGSVYH